jgi:hypothetical protein
MAVIQNLCLAFSMMMITNELLVWHVKFCVHIYHKWTYEFIMKYLYISTVTNVAMV